MLVLGSVLASPDVLTYTCSVLTPSVIVIISTEMAVLSGIRALFFYLCLVLLM